MSDCAYKTIWTFRHPEISSKRVRFELQVCTTGRINEARFVFNGQVLYKNKIKSCQWHMESHFKENIAHNWQHRNCIWPSDLIQWFCDTYKEMVWALADAYIERLQVWKVLEEQELKSTAIAKCAAPNCWQPWIQPGSVCYYNTEPDEFGIPQIKFYAAMSREQIEKDLHGVELLCSSDFDYYFPKRNLDNEDDD